MINWKKEGYVVGENVLIVNKFGLYNQRENFIDGVVTYVGTKILKVSILDNENERILTFNGRSLTSNGRKDNSVAFGDFYIVYKSREAYDKEVSDRKKRDNLKTYITRNLIELDLDTLVSIKDEIDKFKNNKNNIL